MHECDKQIKPYLTGHNYFCDFDKDINCLNTDCIYLRYIKPASNNQKLLRCISINKLSTIKTAVFNMWLETQATPFDEEILNA